MSDNATQISNIDRRAVLSHLTRWSLLCLSPTALHADSSNDFHISIAQKAKHVRIRNGAGLRILIPTGSKANIWPVAREFRKLTGINIELNEAPVDELNTQLILSVLDGQSDYDLALPATFGVPDLVASNAIIPLTRFATIYETPDFREGILYSTGNTFDGQLYGYQADGDAYLMFYHRELLENKDEQARYADQFGEPLKVPDTWAQLDQQMAYFHRENDGLIGGLLYRTPSYLTWEWWIRFHAKGLWPLSETLTPQIDSEPGVLALEEMIKATEYLAPEVRRIGLFDNWKRYSKGDIYCNIGWGGTQKYLNGRNSPMRGKILYGMTPGGIINGQLVKTPYFNWGWNYVVTTVCATPELAYLFALFASTPAMSTLSVSQEDGFFDPIRREHYTNNRIQEIYSEEFLQIHEKSLVSAIPDLYLANQGEYFKSLSNGLDKAMSGILSPENALKRVARQWDMISRRIDKSKQTNRWLNLRQKYPAAIRNQLTDLE